MTKETFSLRRRIAYRARWRDGTDLHVMAPVLTPPDAPWENVFRSDRSCSTSPSPVETGGST
jgi:hypothetical protein